LIETLSRFKELLFIEDEALMNMNTKVELRYHRTITEKYKL